MTWISGLRRISRISGSRWDYRGRSHCWGTEEAQETLEEQYGWDFLSQSSFHRWPQKVAHIPLAWSTDDWLIGLQPCLWLACISTYNVRSQESWRDLVWFTDFWAMWSLGVDHAVFPDKSTKVAGDENKVQGTRHRHLLKKIRQCLYLN